MARDLEREAEEAEKLAQLRWGSTGFRCPHCAHRHAYKLSRRPRMRECRRCGRQTSVTSGTLLHQTRLPLSAWTDCGETLAHSPTLPTTSQLAAQLQIARSSAWLLNQKLMCATIAPLQERGLLWPWRARVRRPQGPPLCATVPEELRELHERHRRGLIRPVDITCALELSGARAGLDAVGLTLEQRFYLPIRSGRRPSPRFYPAELCDWLTQQLRRVHRTVSLRWLPRWLAAHLAAWNRPPGELSWARAALALSPRPLPLLDPWLRLFSHDPQPAPPAAGPPARYA